MTNIKRFFLTVAVLVAFFSPFFAVVAIQNMKRENKLAVDRTAENSAKKDAQDARYQYYLGVAQQREAGKKSMADAKNQYDQLLKDQPKLIQDNQKTVTQTTTEPFVTQKVVEQPVTTTTTVAAPVASKPKVSTRTKTS